MSYMDGDYPEMSLREYRDNIGGREVVDVDALIDRDRERAKDERPDPDPDAIDATVRIGAQWVTVLGRYRLDADGSEHVDGMRVYTTDMSEITDIIKAVSITGSSLPLLRELEDRAIEERAAELARRALK